MLYGVGGPGDVAIFKLTASAQSIYREVYAGAILIPPLHLPEV